MSVLITPDLVAQACIDVVTDLHREHLAALERQLGLPAQTIEPLATVDVLAGEGFRLRSDRAPCCLLGIFGLARTPESTKNGLRMTWALAVEISVVGTDRADVIRRRDWYAMVVAECLIQRVPRQGSPIDTVELADVDLVAAGEEGTQETVGQARMLLDVAVRESLDPHGLPAADTPLEPGTPGGAPLTPYEPPVLWPVADPVHASTEKTQP